MEEEPGSSSPWRGYGVVRVPPSPPEETERGRGRQRARVGRDEEDAGGWSYNAAVRR
jgi:hypothetical protein